MGGIRGGGGLTEGGLLFAVEEFLEEAGGINLVAGDGPLAVPDEDNGDGNEDAQAQDKSEAPMGQKGKTGVDFLNPVDGLVVELSSHKGKERKHGTNLLSVAIGAMGRMRFSPPGRL